MNDFGDLGYLSIPVSGQIELTPFRIGDEPNLVKYLNNQIIFQNTLHIPYPYSETDAKNWLLTVAEKLEENVGEETQFAIRHADFGVIGGIGVFFHSGRDGHRDELGYWIAEPFRGQGLMTKVILAFSGFQFQIRPQLVRLEAFVFDFNLASLRVLEKCGFEKEGFHRKYQLKKGKFLDAFSLAKIRED